MKRVLLISDSNMSLSGVPVVFMSIVRILKTDYVFDIVVLKDNDMYFEKEFLSYGGKVFKYHQRKPEGFFRKMLWLFLKYPKSIKRFIKQNIDLKEYSAIHSFNEGFSYPFIKEALKAGIKNRILHICSAKSAYPLKMTFSQLVFNWYQKKAKKCCTAIAFVSKKSLELNDYKSKGVVLYNIYDEKKFGEIINCNHKNLVLTQIGTFSERKNQLFSLSVINQIKKTIPNVLLNIVGYEIEDGYLQKIHEYIDKNELELNIKILGNKTDRIELNKETSYILYPSTMESFGLVLIESQACGIHCFANKNIPNDADMGNTEFLDLDVSIWSNRILNYYFKNNNSRHIPINVERFSKVSFRSQLIKLYSNF